MNKRNTLVIALLVWTARASAEGPVKVDLFTAGEGGYAAYRIPGIVALGDVVLAYCEARKDGRADWGQIDVLLRRSTDGGRTWGPPRRIASAPAGATQNPVARNRKPGAITVNNPVAIADPERGRVHFLYCVEYNRCFYAVSNDGGETFSEPVEITGTFEQFRPEYDWNVLATGPGHGIRLTNGRLVVPVWLSTSTGGPHRPSRIATIYSDDGGKSWRRGELVTTPDLVNPSETAAVELTGGRVMLNIRHESEPRVRAVCVGPDGATGWERPRFDHALPDPVCMGSILRVGDQLVFSNLDHSASRERKNLTIRTSDDGGKTWPVARAIEPGPSAYSDLAASPDGETVYCFYERGGNLTLARGDREWLTHAP